MDDRWRTIEELKRKATLQVLFRVARMLNEMGVKRIASIAPNTSLRPAHTSLFPHIPHEGIRLVDLAARMGISKQAVFQLVEDLVGEGMLMRRQDPSDGRSKLICFSDLGMEAIKRGLATLSKMEQELVLALGDQVMDQLRTSVLAVHDHLNRQEYKVKQA